MISTIVGELSDLWGWIAGLVAGLGFVAIGAGFVIGYLLVSLHRINKVMDKLENRLVTSERDLSLRIRKIEK